jgi:hypothetical protein
MVNKENTMKKLLILVVCLFGLCFNTFAERGIMYNPNVITGTLTANTNTTTEAIDLSKLLPEGFFSAQILVTGDGTLKVEYQVSNVASSLGSVPATGNFIIPTGATDIVTAHTKTSGTGGLDLYVFPASGDPLFAKWFRLKLTETSTTDSVVYTIYLNIQ